MEIKENHFYTIQFEDKQRLNVKCIEVVFEERWGYDEPYYIFCIGSFKLEITEFELINMKIESMEAKS